MPPTDKQSEHCSSHSGLVSDIDNLKLSDSRQWLAIEKMQSRLPVWATLFISALTFALGASLTYAALAVQITKSGGA